MALRFIAVATEGTVVGTFFDEFVGGDPIVIGRDEDADLVLPEPTVSLRHVEIRAAEGGWVVEDLGSRLGTRLNGKKLRAGEGVPLRVGDKIEVGIFRILFAGEQEGEPVQGTREIARRLAHQLEEGSGGQLYLEVENGPAAGMRYVLAAGRRLRLGRGRKCEVPVDDARVSRVHAVVENRGGEVWFEDTGSTNGSHVNGIRAKKPVLLEDGARVEIGRVRLRLVVGAGRETGWMGVVETAREQAAGWILPSAIGLLVGLLGLLAAALL